MLLHLPFGVREAPCRSTGILGEVRNLASKHLALCTPLGNFQAQLACNELE